MPSKTPLQARFFAACSHGAGYESCPPLKVSKEFNKSDAGTGILRHHHAGGGSVDEIVNAATQLARQPMQAGGFSGFSAENPWWERAEARQIGDRPYGFSVGSGGGRTDRNNVNVASGSYVLPADVVSGLGEGNSLAGAATWDKILHSLPYGIHDAAPARHGMGPPRPPSGLAPPGQGAAPGIAHGGTAPAGKEPDGEVPIQAADGEIIVHPEDVKRFGIAYMPDGQTRTPSTLIKYGHSVLDQFVKSVRGRTIKTLKELPGPVNSKNPEKGHIEVKD